MLRLTSPWVTHDTHQYDDDRSTGLDIDEFASLVLDLRESSTSSIQTRLNLRTNTLVMGALDAWWSAAVRSMTDPDKCALDYPEYIKIMSKVRAGGLEGLPKALARRRAHVRRNRFTAR